LAYLLTFDKREEEKKLGQTVPYTCYTTLQFILLAQYLVSLLLIGSLVFLKKKKKEK
jgi:hypothetical protein